MGVIFNEAMPLMAAHMVVAAYLVGGFLVASVYAVGHAARPRATATTGSGFIIPFTVAAIATPIQMGVGDSLARWVYNNQPVKFAAIELVPKTTQRRARDAVRPPQRRRHQVSGGIPIPGLASILSDPSDGHEHRGPGPRHVPGGRAADHPRRSTSSTSPGTSWSASARCCSCSSLWYWAAWIFRRRHAEEQVVPAGRGRRRRARR